MHQLRGSGIEINATDRCHLHRGIVVDVGVLSLHDPCVSVAIAASFSREKSTAYLAAEHKDLWTADGIHADHAHFQDGIWKMERCQEAVCVGVVDLHHEDKVRIEEGIHIRESGQRLEKALAQD